MTCYMMNSVHVSGSGISPFAVGDTFLSQAQIYTQISLKYVSTNIK